MYVDARTIQALRGRSSRAFPTGPEVCVNEGLRIITAMHDTDGGFVETGLCVACA
jgi:hypothetical protein